MKATYTRTTLHPDYLHFTQVSADHFTDGSIHVWYYDREQDYSGGEGYPSLTAALKEWPTLSTELTK